MSTRTGLAAFLADAVERELQEFMDSVRTRSEVYDLLDHHMGWSARPEGGAGTPPKRLRPLILLLVVEALAGDVALALPVAAAVELLHSAALVFDDIQDRATMRRGRPAVWQVCGAAQAINVGLALQSAVQLAVVRAVRSGLPPSTALEVSEELGQCMLRLVEGQYLDISFEGPTHPSIDDYMRMCGAKTASLFGSAAHLGAVLAGGRRALGSARRLGYHLGMYLQIEDDVAGIWGDPESTGKLPLDLQGRKKTLPLLYAVQVPDAPVQFQTLAAAYFEGDPLSDDDVAALRAYATDLGGRTYAAEMAGLHRDLARRALADVGGGLEAEIGMLFESIARTLAAPA